MTKPNSHTTVSSPGSVLKKWDRKKCIPKLILRKSIVHNLSIHPHWFPPFSLPSSLISNWLSNGRSMLKLPIQLLANRALPATQAMTKNMALKPCT